jgi:hypothetical protein
MDALPLLRPADVDLSSGQLFRVSARAFATITIVMGVLVAACIWIGWRGGVVFGGRGMIPAVLAWWVVFWLGLFLLFYANDWRKARKPSAWLALATGEGVYLKYRSYRNLGWNQDVSQVAFVPYELIESARIERHTWLTPESQSATRAASASLMSSSSWPMRIWVSSSSGWPTSGPENQGVRREGLEHGGTFR